MTISAWRIVQQRHSADAFSGEGARLFGGRWNSSGVPMVYAAQSRALAALEMLVHLDSPALLRNYILFELTFDESQVSELDGSLPSDWRDDPVPASTQALGDRWIKSAASLALRVPSALIPEENNFLFNPRHPEFSRMRRSEPKRIIFNPRLKGR